MQSQFYQGQKLMGIIIGIHLVVTGISIVLFQEFFLPHLPDLLLSFPEFAPLAHDPQFQDAMAANRDAMITQQAVGFAFNLFWCVMLYLGFNWVRWLWGLGWLFNSIASICSTFFLYTTNLIPPIFLLSLLIFSLLYLWCGSTLLFSPNVRVYMQTMRG